MNSSLITMEGIIKAMGALVTIEPRTVHDASSEDTYGNSPETWESGSQVHAVVISMKETSPLVSLGVLNLGDKLLFFPPTASISKGDRVLFPNDSSHWKVKYTTGGSYRGTEQYTKVGLSKE
jgi:hypothetical protein